MARKKLPEYIAKKLLTKSLNMPYEGVSVIGNDKEELEKIDKLNKTENFVIKVDQGIKKRGKQGLIHINISPYKLRQFVIEFSAKGYSRFLIEHFLPHQQSEERYISIERVREGLAIRYSLKGGVDIEDNIDSLKEIVLTYPFNKTILQEVNTYLGLHEHTIDQFTQFFENLYISFFEINPLVIKDGKLFILDLAVEVDSAGEFFVKNSWISKDFVNENLDKKTKEEIAIERLKENSSASFKLTLLNPNGSIWLLLSGGGASITLADEVYNKGFGKNLANYGEYSGNPNQEETYIYTKQLLNLLLKSKAPKKALIIGGGVANFTDIRVTFKGILQAMTEVQDEMAAQKIKVFVRRGGPNQKEGLQLMKEFLQNHYVLGEVWDEQLILTDIVNKALEAIA